MVDEIQLGMVLNSRGIDWTPELILIRKFYEIYDNLNDVLESEVFPEKYREPFSDVRGIIGSYLSYIKRGGVPCKNSTSKNSCNDKQDS